MITIHKMNTSIYGEFQYAIIDEDNKKILSIIKIPKDIPDCINRDPNCRFTEQCNAMYGPEHYGTRFFKYCVGEDKCEELWNKWADIDAEVSNWEE